MSRSVVKLVAVAQMLMCLSLLAVAPSASAEARGMTVTPFVGFRTGGNFEDAATERDLDIDDSEVAGLILGWDWDPGQFEVSYTHQSTELDPDSSTSPDLDYDVDIANLMFAGKLHLHPDAGTYLSFLLGLTEIDIDSSEFDSYIRPAIGLEGGIDHRFDETFGIRFGIRGIVSILGTDSKDLCDRSNNCPVLIDDSKLTQWDFFTGLSFRF